MSHNLTHESIKSGGRVDRTQFIRSFVESQQHNLPFYAAEGKSTQRTWAEGPTTSEDAASVSVFNSPVLKPRVPQPVQESIELNRQTVKKAKANPARGAAIEEKSAPDEKPTKRHKSPPHAPEKPPTKQTTLDPFVKRSRKRVASSDSEREARLAERRERRRAKRAMLRPRDAEYSTESNNENVNESGDVTRKGKGKKKNRDGNFAAGLALMHGFSAANIGASRLTLKPSSGLFHKGKASGKNATKRMSKGSKRRGVTWSEEDFLNRKQTTTESQHEEQVLSSVDENDHTSDMRSSTSASYKSTGIRLENRLRSTKKDRVVDNPGLENDATQSISSEDGPTQSMHKGERPKASSIIWDLERASYVTRNASVVSRSVVLDTTTLKWDTNCKQPADVGDSGRNAEERPTEEGTIHPSHIILREASPVSLGPSQSASQTHRNPSPIVIPQFSRYFPIPQDCSVVHRFPDVGSTPAPIPTQLPPQCPSPSTPEVIAPSPKRDPGCDAFPRGVVSSLATEPIDDRVDEGSHDALSRSLLHSIDDELRSNAGLKAVASIIPDTSEGLDPQERYEDIIFGSGMADNDPPLDGPDLSDDLEYYRATAPQSETRYLHGEEIDTLFHRGGSIRSATSVWEDPHGEMDEGYLEPSQWIPDANDRSLQGLPNYGVQSASYEFGTDEEVSRYSDDILGDEEDVHELQLGSSPQSADIGPVDQIVDREDAETSLSEAQAFGAEEFSHGRALLLGIAETPRLGSSQYQTVSKAEEDVARALRGHWVPQRH